MVMAHKSAKCFFSKIVFSIVFVRKENRIGSNTRFNVYLAAEIIIVNQIIEFELHSTIRNRDATISRVESTNRIDLHAHEKFSKLNKN